MITTVRAWALGLCLFLTTIPVTKAANQTIILKLGSGSVLLLERPYKTVLMEEPNVVDVHTRSGRSVILTPLNLGASTLIFVDENSIVITNIRVLVYDAGTI